jgi:hypothetical protein
VTKRVSRPDGVSAPEPVPPIHPDDPYPPPVDPAIPPDPMHPPQSPVIEPPGTGKPRKLSGGQRVTGTYRLQPFLPAGRGDARAGP